MDKSSFGERSSSVARKLRKRRVDPQREQSVTYPDRLRPGPDRNDDYASAHGAQARMNQSMFSLIAAAGSRTDFHTRFGEESSGSDTEQEADSSVKTTAKPMAGKAGSSAIGQKQAKAKQDKVDIGQGTPAGLESVSIGTEDQESPGLEIEKTRHRRSESNLLKSLPKLRVRSQREKNYMSQSTILPGKAARDLMTSPGPITPRDAPVLRRIIEAQAEVEPESLVVKGAEAPREEGENRLQDSSPKLMSRLKEIFGFDELEEVISEYPCWLLQSVLLQGYLYITAKHFCFYAYLPKRSNKAVKSGLLMKKTKRGPKYNRQWFVLKGHVLTYYDDPSSLYFQAGHVDLRYGISASLAESKDKSKDVRDFTVVTQNRIYYFRADSSTSAKEWVKVLQKTIFRTHNDGDSVKIALPIDNVIDIEESPVIEFARTLKVRVIDNDETFAIDEYFFSFFSFGQDAISIMQSMVSDTNAQRQSAELLSPGAATASPRLAERKKSTEAAITDHVRATISPSIPPVTGRSPRQSIDLDERPSVEDRRRSSDLFQEDKRPSFETRRNFDERRSRNQSPAVPSSGGASKHDSVIEAPPMSHRDSNMSESFVESGMASSGPNMSSDDFQSTGSQVLSRSDIFRPKVNRFPESPDQSDHEGQSPKRMPSTDAGSVKTQIHKPSGSATPRVTEASAMGYFTSAEMESSTPSLKKLIKAGQYPLQRAAGLAGYLHRGSKDVSALLATKSMGYFEKMGGMLAGGRRHYQTNPYGLDDADDEGVGNADYEEHSNRFRAHFGLPDSERLRATYFGSLHRVLPLYGKIYISNKYFCYRSMLPGTKTKIILPLKDIETVDKEKGFSLGVHGLVIVIRGFEELFFEFSQRDLRDDCAVFLLRSLDAAKAEDSSMQSSMDEEGARAAKEEHEALMQARQDGHNAHEIKMPKVEGGVDPDGTPTVVFDDPRASILNFKPTESLRIACLTIGSRGDVQPYIALCKGLLAEGHRPKIATHREFEGWVRGHGIDFAPVEGDPAELMRICVENGMFTVSFFKEATSKFRGWIDELLSSAWTACQDSDLLIESPSAMAGIHIAEALKIPYFRAFTMPWTRTRAYPHAFAVPEHKMGGAYNKMTYVMFDNVFWAAISGQVNRWRKKELQLPSTTLDKQHPNKVPFLYNFSPSVVIPPLDFSDWIRVTGYWFLDEGTNYQPDEKLMAFIKSARADGKKLVYIGFGSIVVSDPVALTKSVVESVQKADVRCILSKGWSDRLGKNVDNTRVEVELPAEILQIKACPHDWLFRQVDCAVHHGGAGTTGASLRAGLPTIVKPFFGDQFFFGSRIEDLGVGVCLKKLNVSMLGRALWEATHSERMITKARVLGEQIRGEDGVGTAIQTIYRDMEYAKSLIKEFDASAAANASGGLPDNDAVGDEESWTFVGDESDPELTKRILLWDGITRHGPDTSVGAARGGEQGTPATATDGGEYGPRAEKSGKRSADVARMGSLLRRPGKEVA